LSSGWLGRASPGSDRRRDTSHGTSPATLKAQKQLGRSGLLSGLNSVALRINTYAGRH
jgi:hypothetical protein